MLHVIGEDIGITIDSTSTVINDTPGRIVLGSDGAEYIYIKASAALTAGDLCIVDKDGNATSATTAGVGTAPQKLCFPQIDFASGDYGYAAISGPMGKINSAASATGSAKMYTTTTAGRVSSTSTSSVLVQGLKLNATTGGSAAVVAGYATKRLCCNCQD